MIGVLLLVAATVRALAALAAMVVAERDVTAIATGIVVIETATVIVMTVTRTETRKADVAEALRGVGAVLLTVDALLHSQRSLRSKKLTEL